MALIDTLLGSIDGAISLSRYLVAAFDGNAVCKLREDNASTELDFKLNGSNVLVSDDVNEDTVSTWLSNNSASNAYIVTWYDQTGNGYDFNALTVTKQPLLNESGINSKAVAESIRLNGTDMRCSTYHMASTNGCYVGLVHSLNENRASVGSIFSDANTSTWLVGVQASLGGYRHLADTGQIHNGSAITLNQAYQVSAEFPAGINPKLVSLRQDGADDGSTSLNIDSRAGAHRIFSAGTIQSLDSYLGELLFTNEVLSSSDRALIESSQGTQFGITIAGGDVTGSGSLVTGNATVVGVGERKITSNGSLVTGNASIIGIGERKVVGSGSLVTGNASISGAGTVGNAVTGSGTLQTSNAAISGTGIRIVTGNASLVTSDASINGVGEREISGSGALVTGDATIIGFQFRETPSTRIIAVQSENRTLLVENENRILTVATENRTLVA